VSDRYLQFSNPLPLERIRARCSACGMHFVGERWRDEERGDSLHRIRAEFEAHVCKEKEREGAT
jgi:hypothetical protein